MAMTMAQHTIYMLHILRYEHFSDQSFVFRSLCNLDKQTAYTDRPAVGSF